MITYRAAPNEHPVIKGSDLWHATWKAEGNGIWSTSYQRHAWDHPEKWEPPFPDAGHRCEQIFVDDAYLKHVDTRAELSKSGTFFTSDDGNAGTLFIHPPGSDSDPATRVVERSNSVCPT